MTDFLTNVANRTLGLSQVMQPKIDSVFAPPTTLASEGGTSLLEQDNVSSVEAAPSSDSQAHDPLATQVVVVVGWVEVRNPTQLRKKGDRFACN